METIGTAAARAVTQAEGRQSQTVLPTLAEKSSTGLIEQILEKPTITAAELATLRDWLLSPSTLELATLEDIARQLQFLSASLPSRATDDETGRRKFAVYASELSGLPIDAIKHMSRRCIAELKWFPVPSECIAFARSWSGMETLRNRVNRKISEYAERTFERFIAQISVPVNQDWLDAQPEQWRRIAVERGYLRWIDGVMVQRDAAKEAEIQRNLAEGSEETMEFCLDERISA